VRAAVACIAAIGVAGCVQSALNDEPLPLEANLQGGWPAERWQVAPRLHDENIAIALIGGEISRGVLAFGCTLGDDVLSIILLPHGSFTASPGESVSLAFDDASPMDDALDGRTLVARHVRYSVFELRDGEPGFATVMYEMQMHQYVEATTVQSGHELSRERFSLDGAGAAIAAVSRTCGK
jgi:hypothetical protein